MPNIVTERGKESVDSVGAGIPISLLPLKAEFTGEEEVLANDNGVTKRIAGLAPFPWTQIAALIKTRAGIPATEAFGCRVTPGLSDPSALVDKDGSTALANLAAIQAFAGSTAAGTANDPVIIENFRFDNSEGISLGIGFTSTASIHVTIRNCWFSGYDIGHIRSTATNLTLNVQDCLFTYDDTTSDPNDTSSNHITMQGGDADLNVTACYASAGGRNFVRTLVAYAGTITVRDSKIDDSLQAWSGPSVNQSAAFEFGGTAASTLDIQFCEISGVANDTMSYGVWVSANQTVAVSFTVKNCLINGTGKSNLGAAIAVSGPGTLAHSGTIQYNKFRNQLRDSINIITCDGIDVLNNDFEDSAINFRHLLANGTAGFDIDNLNVGFNKAAASVGANSEPFYFLSTLNTDCHNNWITQAAEDAIEFTRPQLGCKCRLNVCENVAVQAVDLFEMHATNSGAVEVYGIFGDANIGVDVNDRTDGDDIQEIYVDTTAGSNPIVRLIESGVATNNVAVQVSKMAAIISGSGAVVGTSGTIGINNTFNGITI